MAILIFTEFMTFLLIIFIRRLRLALSIAVQICLTYSNNFSLLELETACYDDTDGRDTVTR